MPVLTSQVYEQSRVLPIESSAIAGSAGEVGQAMGRRQGWFERYTWLVGNVAERIEGWVGESSRGE